MKRVARKYLNAKLSFFSYAQTKDEYNQIVKDEIELCTRWAHLIELNKDEKFVSQRVNSDLSCKIRVPWDKTVADIDSSYFIKYGTRVFNIVSVINDFERNSSLTVMASEVFDEK